ncbi:hypothetical protein U2181_15405, partial [Listeria monocytogenes]|uniref:hypothetical protein n=1 Tax=Listeria monocytogenes TaxID=1639 RepID=UPI002FDC09D2
ANTTKAFADAMVVRRRRQQEILDTLAAAKAECLADPETAKYADDDYDDYDHDHVDDDAPTTKWI